MYLFIIILIILLVLIFLPIPIKLFIIYNKETFQIYLFNFKIYPKKDKTIHNKKNKGDKKKFNISIYDLIYKLDNNKLKPHLRFNFNLNYGLEDAANTAILYGILNSMQPFIIRLLEIIFKIKKFNFFIEPNFQNTEFNINFDCIFFISMANIINIFFIILRCKHSKKTFNNIAVSS